MSENIVAILRTAEEAELRYLRATRSTVMESIKGSGVAQTYASFAFVCGSSWGNDVLWARVRGL